MTKKQAAPAVAPVIVSPSTPQKSAEKFKALHFPTLLNFQNEWLSWDGAAYQSIEDATILAHVSQFLKRAKIKTAEKIDGDDDGASKIVYVPFSPKQKDISEVYGMLKHDCHVPLNTMSPPVWLAGTPKEYAGLNPRNLI